VFFKIQRLVLLFLFIDVSSNLLWPQLFCRRLENVNLVKHYMAEKINSSSLVKRGPYKFWVNYSPFYNLFHLASVWKKYPGEVFISRSFVNTSYSEVALAHEVGHWESNNILWNKSEFDADRFASHIFGPEKTLEMLIYLNKNYGENKKGNQRIERMKLILSDQPH